MIAEKTDPPENRVIVIAFPKSGTKTLNKVFKSLGYKVFDVMQMCDYAEKFNKFGTEEIEFAELAKVWEVGCNKLDINHAKSWKPYFLEFMIFSFLFFFN